MNTKSYLNLINENAENKRVFDGFKKTGEKYQKILENEEMLNNIEERKRTAKEFISPLTLRDNINSSLLKEFFSSMMDKAKTKLIVSEDFYVLSDKIITNYINEETSYAILNKMKGASNFTSSIAFSILESSDKIFNELCPDGKKCDKKTATIDPKDKDDFFDSIITDDLEDASYIVKSRVSDAINQFISDNNDEREQIKNSLEISKQKIDNAKTKELKEEYNALARRQEQKIRDRKMNIFESMVNEMCKSFYENDSIRESYSTFSEKIDMEKIINTTEVFYEFMELLNTINLEPVTESSIEKIIKTIR